MTGSMFIGIILSLICWYTYTSQITGNITCPHSVPGEHTFKFLKEPARSSRPRITDLIVANSSTMKTFYRLFSHPAVIENSYKNRLWRCHELPPSEKLLLYRRIFARRNDRKHDNNHFSSNQLLHNSQPSLHELY